MKQSNQNFSVLTNEMLVEISGGGCILDTIAAHPIKTALFGGWYILGVAYGCYA